MVLCEELAGRYADRTIVGGYDLINEPLSGPVWEEYIPKLKEFYHELVARTVRVIVEAVQGRIVLKRLNYK